jgi:hypothetical protein
MQDTGKWIEDDREDIALVKSFGIVRRKVDHRNRKPHN